ncbi:hypothetical protein ACI2L1_43930 [Streptomyces sp. NPDC019531]|uniref:hypothetical protein n=1 Tax=Streptomyces sp. NPDC019531 TaxID=3365062 RepID=UPI00384D31A2
MHVDVRRGRFRTGYHDLGVGTRSMPETFLKASGLVEYDLATGRQVRLVDPALGPSPIHAADRICVDADGNAYVVDPAAGYVYRVTAGGEASILVAGEPLAPANEGAGITGIALHPRGFLLVNHYSAGRIVRIPLDRPGALSVVLEDPAPAGGDGTVLRRDNSLLVVPDNLAAAAGHDAVVEVGAASCWTTARVAHTRAPWPVPVPTDAAATPYGTYLLSGRADVLFHGGPADDFVLQRL